jgi:hypothetical protein
VFELKTGWKKGERIVMISIGHTNSNKRRKIMNKRAMGILGVMLFAVPFLFHSHGGVSFGTGPPSFNDPTS